VSVGGIGFVLKIRVPVPETLKAKALLGFVWKKRVSRGIFILAWAGADLLWAILFGSMVLRSGVNASPLRV
jgi:hypothetical protein